MISDTFNSQLGCKVPASRSVVFFFNKISICVSNVLVTALEVTTPGGGAPDGWERTRVAPWEPCRRRGLGVVCVAGLGSLQGAESTGSQEDSHPGTQICSSELQCFVE